MAKRIRAPATHHMGRYWHTYKYHYTKNDYSIDLGIYDEKPWSSFALGAILPVGSRLRVSRFECYAVNAEHSASLCLPDYYFMIKQNDRHENRSRGSFECINSLMAIATRIERRLNQIISARVECFTLASYFNDTADVSFELREFDGLTLCPSSAVCTRTHTRPPNATYVKNSALYSFTKTPTIHLLVRIRIGCRRPCLPVRKHFSPWKCEKALAM